MEDQAPPQLSADDVAFQRKRDVEENAESALPQGERVDVVSLTCVELYTPSTVSSLMEAVEALGWVRNDPYRPPFCNLVEWVPASRASPWAGAWVNLGHIVDLNSPRQPGEGLRAPLPPGVEAIWAELHAVTPSVTALVLEFELKESSSRALETVFGSDLATCAERTSNGWAYRGPTNQRSDLVAHERASLRAACQSWVAFHAPGVFCTAADQGLPTIEAFTCVRAEPFQELVPQPLGDYRWALGIEHGWDAWESQQLPGWRLAAWEPRRDEPFVLRLGARRAEVMVDLDAYGGDNNSGLANRLTHPLFAFSTRFALHCLLGLYSRRLADLRDRSVRAAAHPRRNARHRNVQTAMELLVEPSYDLPVVVAEVEALCDDAPRYGRVGADFSPTAEWKAHGPESLIEHLRQSDRAHATSLLAADGRVRETLNGLVSVMSSQVNLRLSWTMTLLTWTATAIALLALVVALR